MLSVVNEVAAYSPWVPTWGTITSSDGSYTNIFNSSGTVRSQLYDGYSYEKGYAIKFDVNLASLSNKQAFIVAPKAPNNYISLPSIYRDNSGVLRVGPATTRSSYLDSSIGPSLGDFNGQAVSGTNFTVCFIMQTSSWSLAYGYYAVVVTDSNGNVYKVWGLSDIWGGCNNQSAIMCSSNVLNGYAVISKVNADYCMSDAEVQNCYNNNGKLSSDPEQPTASGDGKNYSDAEITLTTATSGYKIRYTTDGSVPSSSSALYTSPLTFAWNPASSPVVRSRTYAANGTTPIGGVTSSKINFVVGLPLVTYDTSIMTGGSYFASDAKVTSLTCDSPGCDFYYTLDGSTPTLSSTKWSDQAKLTIPFVSGTNYGSVNLKIWAVSAYHPASGKWSDPDYGPTQYVQFGVDLTLDASFQPSVSSGSDYSVVVSTKSPNTTIYYTLDGSTPSTSSSMSNGTIIVPWQEGSVQLKIAAIHSSGMSSNVAVTNITFIIGLPVIVPHSASSTSPVDFTVSAPVEYSTILYTTDGSTPTVASRSATNPGVISLKPGEILKACTARSGTLSTPTVAYNFNPYSVVKTAALASSTGLLLFYETRQDIIPDFPYVASTFNAPSLPSSPVYRHATRFLAAKSPVLTITPSSSNQVFSFTRLPSMSGTYFYSASNAAFQYTPPSEDTLFAIESTQQFMISYAAQPNPLVPPFHLYYSASTVQIPCFDTLVFNDFMTKPSFSVVSAAKISARLKFSHAQFSTSSSWLSIVATQSSLTINGVSYPIQEAYDIKVDVMNPDLTSPYFDSTQLIDITVSVIANQSSPCTISAKSMTNPVMSGGSYNNVVYPQTALNLPADTTGLLILNASTGQIDVQHDTAYVPVTSIILGAFKTVGPNLINYVNLLRSSLIRVRQQTQSLLGGGSIVAVGSNLVAFDDRIEHSNGVIMPSDLSFKFPDSVTKSSLNLSISVASA
jgi:hypothetical protein